MSLIKMLSYARSLRGEGDLKSAYQLTQDNLMPNFSRSSLRPIPAREEPIGNGAGCARSQAKATGSETLDRARGALRAGASQEKGKTMQEQQDETLVHSSSRSGMSAQVAAAAGAGVQRSRWLGGRTSPRATLRADAKGQLSLEFVKVVRNDLSDSDLELVPAKPLAGGPSKRAGSGPGSSLESMEPEPSRWSRFTARIFGSGNPT